jgi:hypothetical protein
MTNNERFVTSAGTQEIPRPWGDPGLGASSGSHLACGAELQLAPWCISGGRACPFRRVPPFEAASRRLT